MSPPALHVLIINDDEADRRLIRRRLAEPTLRVRVSEATGLREGVNIVQHDSVDVVLLDLTLPETSGLTTLRKFQRSVPDVPVVILAGTTDEELALTAIEGGAQDFIMKNDLGNPWLLRYLRNAMQRHDLQECLKNQSLLDSLTGLPNRALLERSLDALFQGGAGSESAFTVVFIDLDEFKLINDCYGHGEGDRVLTEFARRLKGCVRSSDMVARFGGDEFVVLLKDVKSEQDVKRFVDRLTQALDQPVTVDGNDLFLATSIGYVSHSARYTDCKHMLRDADTAMYEAKKAGKRTHRRFSQAMREDALETAGMGSRLRQALDNEELALVFQPIVELETGRTMKFEALLRWHHPERGAVPPMVFIPHAERTGEIVPIGLWVLKTACQQLRQWDDAFPHNNIQMCVNVSPIQVLKPDFGERVVSTLQESGVSCDRISLEITESTIMEDADRTVGVLQSLRHAGIRISIDDFGTGYSSLSQLHRFKFDSLKIDRSFVRELLTEGYADLLVQTMLLLAKSVGLDVIAEGIETQAEADRLVELGCSIGQGFLFGKPMPPEMATELLEARQPGELCVI